MKELREDNWGARRGHLKPGLFKKTQNSKLSFKGFVEADFFIFKKLNAFKKDYIFLKILG